MNNPRLFFAIAFLIPIGIVQAQPECTLRKNSNGIKVYTCPVKDSNLKAIKASFDLESGLGQLVAVIKDVPAYTAWQYHMIESKLVSQGKNELIYHSEISAPWPVSNRDMVVQLKFKYDSVNSILDIDAIGLPALVPLVEDNIRIPHFKANWNIYVVKENHLRIEYNLMVDIGGSIPAWLMNMAQAEGPFETFSKLKTQVTRGEYQSRQYLNK